MSTKTIKQRISLVAVSALTAGVLSVVAAPVANAAELTVSAAATNTPFAANILYVANDTAGTAVASATIALNQSKTGLRLYDSSIGTTATQEVWMATGNAIAMYTGAATDNELMITATGGAFGSPVVPGGTPGTKNTGDKEVYSVDTVSTSVLWTPSAVGTYTIKLFTGAAVDSTYASITSGSLVTTITAYVGTASDLEVYVNGASATTSRGIISTNGTAGNSRTSIYGTTSSYGVMLSSGSAYVTQIAGAATGGIKVSGGTFSSCAAAGGGATVTLNASITSCINSTTTDTLVIAVPNSDATSMTITGFTTSGLVTSQAAITYSVVAASTANKFSAAASFISAELTGIAATNNIDATNTDTTGTAYSGTIVPAGVSGYLGYDLKDAYGTQLSAHVLGASVTGGCLVGFNQAAAANTYTASSTTTAVGYITVSRVTSTSPYSCTLTLTDNGVTIASRTYTLLGQAASVTVTGLKRVKTGAAANDDAMEVNVFDSAGNVLDGATFSVVSSYLNSGLTSITADRASDRDGELGDADVTCITSGTYDFAMQVTNASLATISSPVYKLSCTGSPDSFTAGLDKASYAPGEIATLTITAKDSKGNLVHDYAVLGTAGAAATEASLTGGMLTIIGSNTAALLNAIKFTNGVAKFKFTVGATSGSYNMVVDLPTYPNAAGANQAQTVSYKVANNSEDASFEEVLQSVIALIASINKQIQALQKLILARR